jgi:membrane-associated phospholipid phosphatase
VTVLTRIRRADRNLTVRLAVAAVATFALGLPFLWLAVRVREQWGPLVDLDTTVAEELNAVALRNDWLVHLMEAVSIVLGPWVLRPVVTVLAIVLLARHRPRLASWVLVTLWVGALLGVVLKLVVDRARPELTEAVATAGGRSFPSGHALGATIAVGLLALVLGSLLARRGRVLLWIGAVLAVLLVCFSRIVLGVHYLSDVTAGVVLGVAWLAVTAAAFHAWRRDVGLPPSPADELAPEWADGAPEPTR